MSTMTMGAPAEQDRFSKYFGYAVAAHVGLILAMAFVPSGWLGGQVEAERNVMYISLGGSVGDRTTGLRSADARAVQEATPEPVRPQFQAPAEKAPEMAIPEKIVKAPAKPAPKTPIVSTPAARPNTRTPIRGAEVREGQARVDTGATTGAGGLAVGGGGTGGETNLANFCCPAYIEQMTAAIRRNWKQHQGVAGLNTVRFTIERDGRITGLEMLEPSGVYALDRDSLSKLLNAKVTALPAEFKEPALVIRLIFEYKR
jgi:TonB family protein